MLDSTSEVSNFLADSRGPANVHLINGLYDARRRRCHAGKAEKQKPTLYDFAFEALDGIVEAAEV